MLPSYLDREYNLIHDNYIIEQLHTSYLINTTTYTSENFATVIIIVISNYDQLKPTRTHVSSFRQFIHGKAPHCG